MRITVLDEMADLFIERYIFFKGMKKIKLWFSYDSNF